METPRDTSPLRGRGAEGAGARISLPTVLLALLVAQGCGGPLAHVDGSLFPPPPRNAVTFWGHACSYVDVDGYGIVTDPVFEKQLNIRRRKVPIPPPTSYEHTRLVLISHAHNDHLNAATLATFPASAMILCPEPAARYLSDLPQRVKIMRPGETHAFPGGRVTAVPAYHTGGRWAVVPVPDGRALGYVIDTAWGTIYYSGDTDYFRGIEEVAEQHAPNLALLNINGAHLTWKEAVRTARTLGVPTVVPMHFGAFGYLILGEQKRPRGYDKAQRELGDVLHLLELGESLPLSHMRSTSLP